MDGTVPLRGNPGDRKPSRTPRPECLATLRVAPHTAASTGRSLPRAAADRAPYRGGS
ncbi:hypothetical protein M2390_000150 [Mycetocola sp. BIGb0189]|nr:hypothetical protein [Mycetocola sp. BIGb0189]